MLVKPERKRKKGRPRRRLMDVVKNELRNLGVVNWKKRHKNVMAEESF
jgi:hypothetical protein